MCAALAESSKRALDTVGDILGEFLSRISKLLRVNMDKSCFQEEGFEVRKCVSSIVEVSHCVCVCVCIDL